MKTAWKFYIHVVLGGLSLVLILGGILWILLEQTPESALAFVGGLIALFGWFQTREHEKEQSQDKVDTFKKLDQMSTEIPERVAEKNEFLLERSQLNKEGEQKAQLQMAADRKLLKELWKFINWRDLDQIVDQIHYGVGDYDFYKEKVIAYWYFREQNTERQLQTPKLSQALSEFDAALQKFDRQLSRYADAEPMGDRWIWFPHYKYRLSQEMYEYKHREYRQAVDYGMDMLDKHKALVSVIRELFPDFFET